MKTADLKEILIRLDEGRGAGKQEIKLLLSLSDPDHIDQLFEAARRVRSRIFGKGVFLYGFLYFSTHCRNDCWFCHYRQSNKQIPRYRKTRAEILAAAREMSAAGVHLIDLTMGEDPKLYANNGAGFDGFISMIQAVQKETDLPVMISPGALPDMVIKQLAETGVTWYACYQETHTHSRYSIFCARGSVLNSAWPKNTLPGTWECWWRKVYSPGWARPWMIWPIPLSG